MQNTTHHARTLPVEELTETQRFWFKHYQAWQASGKSQADYARTQGLSIKSLYYWNKKFQQCGDRVSEPQSSISPFFQKIQVTPSPVNGARCSIHFANGMTCELSGLDGLGLEQLLLTVSRLPQ